MKITILGRGNAGCLTALHYSHYARHKKNISVELLYDSNIPPEKVGQATLLEPPKLLWAALGINWYNNPIQATPKFGILYENWGKKNHKFIHPFPLNTVALHYAPTKLQDTILKSKYFKVREKHINNYDEIDSDYIFDCRGRHITNWNDYTMLTNPLNAVILIGPVPWLLLMVGLLLFQIPLKLLLMAIYIMIRLLRLKKLPLILKSYLT